MHNLDKQKTAQIRQTLAAMLSMTKDVLTNMNLKILYRRSIFYPTYVLLVVAFVYSVISGLTNDSPRHEHTLEWYELAVVNVVMGLIYSILVGVFSLTLFLNKFEKIRESPAMTRITWFLLPFGFILTVIGKAINELITVDSFWELIFATLAGLPFIVGLIYGFRKFSLTKDGETIREHSS